MSTLHAPDARPLENATEHLERTQEAEEPPTPGPSTTLEETPITPSLVQALYDYTPEESGELAFKRGDLIEFLDKSDWSQWHRGKIYSGETKGRAGIYPVTYVHGVDPSFLALHDLLIAKLEGTNEVAHRVPSRSAETYPGGEDALREKPLDGVSTPPERDIPCLVYVHGACQKGTACWFSHDLSSANVKICQDYVKGTCKTDRCALLHIRSPEVWQKDQRHPSPKAPELKLPPQSPSASLEPVVLGSIARQDSDIRPDLLLPKSDNIPEEWQTIDEILKNNPNYGARTRDFVPSRSVPLQQIRENRQLTPPLPKQSEDQSFGVTDEAADIQARCRQLRAQLFDAGKNDLFYTLTRSQDSTQPKTSVLSIAALQHMALHQLQYDISCYVGLMYRTSQFYMELQGFPPLTELMNKYCDAIRNLDYMKQCALRGYEEDPFLMKSSRALERSILETTKLVPNHVLPAGPLPLPKDAGNPQLSDIGRNEANQAAYQKKRLLRFAMAGLGALLLVVPMLIMANVPGKISSLVTTCIALLIFSVLITLLTELGPHEILATTAAYAAVLVVFVGTSLSAQTVVVSPSGSGLSK